MTNSSETPQTKSAMKFLAAAALLYFIGFECWFLLKALDIYNHSQRLLCWGAIIYMLNFIVLAIGVIREKRPHENLVNKVMAVYGFGVALSLIFIFITWD